MLTDIQVRATKPAGKPYKLRDSRGLYLQVMPNGGRYWRFNYRFQGRQKTLALGTYPDVPLIQTRERHHEARRLLAEDVDPGAATRAASQDFEAVARAWLAHWRPGQGRLFQLPLVDQMADQDGLSHPPGPKQDHRPLQQSVRQCPPDRPTSDSTASGDPQPLDPKCLSRAI